MTPLGYRSPNDLEELLLIQGASPIAYQSSIDTGSVFWGQVSASELMIY
jgi:hypothetical protein